MDVSASFDAVAACDEAPLMVVVAKAGETVLRENTRVLSNNAPNRRIRSLFCINTHLSE